MNHFQLAVAKGTLAFEWNLLGQLTRVRWYGNHYRTSHGPGHRAFLINTRKVPDHLVDLFEKFRAYFDDGVPFGEIPWELLEEGPLTEFQKKVYRATLLIPHGETRTYSWIAERTGSWTASRAVGQALRKNPFLILVPCHRVVSSHGGLGGFMGKIDPDQPELVLKKLLLDLEDTYLNPFFSFMGDAGVKNLALAG